MRVSAGPKLTAFFLALLVCLEPRPLGVPLVSVLGQTLLGHADLWNRRAETIRAQIRNLPMYAYTQKDVRRKVCTHTH